MIGTHKKTIVCVDDELRILNSLKMLFKKDYKVLATTDGNEAVQLLKKEKVHVIISDQRMPKITGVEVLKQAHQVSPNTMRVLLTGYSDLVAIISSINEGEIYRFANKPWTNGHIKQLVSNAVSISDGLWDESQQSNEQLDAQKITSSPTEELPLTGIIVLDQDENTLKALKKSETFSKQKLYDASSIEMALDLLEHKKIGVVIADISCGKESIIDFIKILKAEHPLVLTIVQTELLDFSSIVSLINDGQIFRYLPKPITIKKIETHLTHAIKRYHEYSANPALLKQHKVDDNLNHDQNGAENIAVSSTEQKNSITHRIGQRLRRLRQRLRY